MVTEEKIWEALQNCYDPEIPINIVDLGLVYDVAVANETVKVKMTLTAPGCPMHSTISQDVREKLLAVAGVKDAQGDVVWEPPWSPAMMSDAAKTKLGFSE